VSKRPTVLFLSHDASRSGAPMLLLRLTRWLRANADLEIEFLVRKSGPLEVEFAEVGRVTMFRDEAPATGGVKWRLAKRLGAGGAAAGVERARALRNLARRGVALVYANTATNGPALEYLARLGCPVLTHIHESEPTLRRHGDANFALLDRHTTRYLACAEAVKSDLAGKFGVAASRIDVVHGFVDDPQRSASDLAALRASRRAQLGLPADAFVVGACGETDWQKGADLFVHLARLVQARGARVPVRFVWVGGGGGPTDRRSAEIAHDLARLGIAETVHFIGRRADAAEWFAAFDAFALVSREDSFPLTCLEAASLGVPVLCFAGAGGEPEFVEEDAGFVVPYLDVEAMAERVREMAASPALRQSLGRRAMQKVRERHDVAVAGPKILEIMRGMM
jgi:glycosyltransferase involved in cell wall biosynthesis